METILSQAPAERQVRNGGERGRPLTPAAAGKGGLKYVWIIIVRSGGLGAAPICVPDGWTVLVWKLFQFHTPPSFRSTLPPDPAVQRDAPRLGQQDCPSVPEGPPDRGPGRGQGHGPARRHHLAQADAGRGAAEAERSARRHHAVQHGREDHCVRQHQEHVRRGRSVGRGCSDCNCVTSLCRHTLRSLASLLSLPPRGRDEVLGPPFNPRPLHCSQIAERIGEAMPCVVLHGDISQAARDRGLQQFREGKYPVLVATDVAARGLDIPSVELVLHYDVPQVSAGRRSLRCIQGRASGAWASLLIQSSSGYISYRRNVGNITVHPGAQSPSPTLASFPSSSGRRGLPASQRPHGARREDRLGDHPVQRQRVALCGADPEADQGTVCGQILRQTKIRYADRGGRRLALLQGQDAMNMCIYMFMSLHVFSDEPVRRLRWRGPS